MFLNAKPNDVKQYIKLYIKPSQVALSLGLLSCTAITSASIADELIISEYIEGSSNNKAIELYKSKVLFSINSDNWNLDLTFLQPALIIVDWFLDLPKRQKGEYITKEKI